MAPVKETTDVSTPKIAKMDETTTAESEECQTPKGPMEILMKALEVLDQKFDENDAKLDRLKLELEIKHEKSCKELLEKRKKFISGEYKPTAEDLKSSSSDEIDGKRLKYVKKVKENPEFWLTVLKRSLGSIIQKHDEPVLSHLEDIKMKIHDSPIGFTLEFHFSENEYFTDKVLTKYYARDPKIKFQGCEISWNKTKNVTLEYVEKKVTGEIKQLNIKPVNSFFNLFNNPVKYEPTWEMKAVYEKNFKIFQHIINDSLPRAVHYYTKEIRSENQVRGKKGDSIDSGFVVVNK